MKKSMGRNACQPPSNYPWKGLMTLTPLVMVIRWSMGIFSGLRTMATFLNHYSAWRKTFSSQATSQEMSRQCPLNSEFVKMMVSPRRNTYSHHLTHQRCTVRLMKYTRRRRRRWWRWVRWLIRVILIGATSKTSKPTSTNNSPSSRPMHSTPTTILVL